MKKILTLIMILLVIAVGWFAWQYFQAPEIDAGFASGNGRVEAVQVDISTKIAGRVEGVYALEGDLVEAQQKLAKIDTNQLHAQLLRYEADVASAQSQVASANAGIAQAKAEKLLAEQELARAKELIKQNNISKETYDTRASTVTVANANVDAAEALKISRLRSVDAAKAVVEEVQTQIDDATLFAPTIGRVLYRLAEPGEVLGSGGKVLTLIDLSDVYMEIFLPTEQAHRIEIGAQARVKLDVLDVAIPAKVSFVSPESQYTPKQVETATEREKLMFRVKVRIPQELVLQHIDKVKTGVRGVAYIRLSAIDGEPAAEWPDFLKKLPANYKLETDSER
ncbi:HlyD family efflux transporter periplasmic adaptor subunit [Paraglaciecola sp. 20A4]|uniref:HlyD family secretion protein n=1 Tax=Paraglaciecola sp. 20A4 TaxID=2687288 RepID=UPI001F0FD70F|nr:HlyD family efflux transporter periplasmic adaptor subunit [Paraglaciecola sp. 20A4]